MHFQGGRAPRVAVAAAVRHHLGTAEERARRSTASGWSGGHAERGGWPGLGVAGGVAPSARRPGAPGSRPWHHCPVAGSATRRAARSVAARRRSGGRSSGGDSSPATAPVDLPAGHVLRTRRPTGRPRCRSRRDSVTWLGHAGFLIRLGGRTIITDPYLAECASPVPPFGPRRFAPPRLRADQLPPIDILLLSHNHYDHLDLPALQAIGDPAPDAGDAAGHGALCRPEPFARRWSSTGTSRSDSSGCGSRPCRRSISASGPSRSQPDPVVRLSHRGRPAHDPVRRRHRLRPGVRGGGPAPGASPTWRSCRSAPTSPAL